jgi:hypothetical protein
MREVAVAINGMEEVLTHVYANNAKKVQGGEGEVAVVKMHTKMCQGPAEIEALTAGGKILACVGDTDAGDTEELTDWMELLEANNAHREEVHEGIEAKRKVELKAAAVKGKVYTLHLNSRYTAATAARHVALEIMEWRARTLVSTDPDLIPESIAYVMVGGDEDPCTTGEPRRRASQRADLQMDGRWSAEHCTQA